MQIILRLIRKIEPVYTVTKADLDKDTYYCNTILHQCAYNQDDATDFSYITDTLKMKNLHHGLQQVKLPEAPKQKTRPETTARSIQYAMWLQYHKINNL